MGGSWIVVGSGGDDRGSDYRSAVMETTKRSARRVRGVRLGFTLVELLVVITIIGILASLITVAAVGALKRARETEIKTEIDQLDGAFVEYKNRYTAFPPNCQTDGNSGPLDDTAVSNNLKRHLQQIAGRSQEPPELIAKLLGLVSGGLEGGMTSQEAVVFWLSGFSSDPRFPISGEGGPSYLASLGNNDPVESRRWIFPFDVGRLAPRGSDGYFAGRYIEYTVTIPGQNNNQPQRRRINFWEYRPRKSDQPYLYFDTSRHAAAIRDSGNNLVGPYDPPAATLWNGGLHVHAFKKLNESTADNVPIQFVNPDKFQIIHCGDDGAWGEESFERMSVHAVGSANPNDYLLFPTGPFTGDVADTIVNFTSRTRIEDAQQ